MVREKANLIMQFLLSGKLNFGYMISYTTTQSLHNANNEIVLVTRIYNYKKSISFIIISGLFWLQKYISNHQKNWLAEEISLSSS